MNFKIGDKVKIISLNNTFPYLVDKEFINFLNKTFTVYETFTAYDILHSTKQNYVKLKENDYYWSMKDLILVNNTLEIE